MLSWDVGYWMIKDGMATVYEAKYGAEFGRFERKYRMAEAVAKAKGVGMWSKPSIVGMLKGRTKELESPRAFKTRMQHLEKVAKPK